MTSKFDRLSLGTIRCVREVLRHESISLAARYLGISQPAVSQQLARFEQASGVPVLARRGNVFSIHSREAAALIEQISDALDRMEKLIEQDETGMPRLGISDCLATLFSSYPDDLFGLKEKYRVDIATPHALTTMYDRGEIDIAIRPLFAQEPETEFVLQIPMVWLASIKLARDTRNPLPVVGWSNLSPYAAFENETLASADIEHTLLCRVDDHSLRGNLVSNGRAAGLMPEFLHRSLLSRAEQFQRLETGHRIRFCLFARKQFLSARDARNLFGSISHIILQMTTLP